MRAYYNEFEPYAADWLDNLIAAGLIPSGKVDRRSITEVEPSDLEGFTQCHFFAGIGGWAYALELAGWPEDEPVWTGSCPCQPFSSARRGRTDRTADLWPEWFRLVSARTPRTIFGEQVAHESAWLDRLCDDLETLDYEVGAAILPACSIGLDHMRSRIFFAGHADRKSKSGQSVNGQVAWLQGLGCQSGEMAATHGVPSRVGRLRAYGNAIVPQVAAEFIAAYRDLN